MRFGHSMPTLDAKVRVIGTARSISSRKLKELTNKDSKIPKKH